MTTGHVQLREERNGLDRRFLRAHVDAGGDLHIDGQDLGPGTAMVSDDGEYEWFITIRREHVPRVVDLLGGGPRTGVIELLRDRYCGDASYELERLLRESDIPQELNVW